MYVCVSAFLCVKMKICRSNKIVRSHINARYCDSLSYGGNRVRKGVFS